MKKNAVAIILPCFNENNAIIKLLKALECVLDEMPCHFEVIVVDDASTNGILDLLQEFRFHKENLSLTILSLNLNIGHQGAIYQGLLYAQHLPIEKFIIMDADGEDDPRAIPYFFTYADCDIVHVVRGKRQESLLFKVCYYLYKVLFKFITGKQMNFGNYCMINRKVVENITHTSFIHFAAYLSKQKVKKAQIVFDRLTRLDGKSKMKFSELIYHGFKSLIEYSEDLLMLFLKLSVFLGLLFSFSILCVFYLKLFTDTAIPGWASVVIIGVFNSALISIGFFVMGLLLLNLSHYKTTTIKSGTFQKITPQKNEK